TKESHAIESLATEFLSLHLTPIESLIGKGKNRTTIDKLDIEQVTNYSCAAVDAVLRLAEIMEKQLSEKKLHKLFYEIEMPLVSVLADMEISGIKVDIEYLENLSDEMKIELNKLQEEIYKQAGYEFNINSSKQLGFLLFEKLQLPHIKRTKTQFSTDEEVLRTLTAFHPLPKKIVEYRELQKLKSTYVDSLIALADEKTHRVHTSFNQTITATGRLSSTKPNLQNIPVRTQTGRKIRRGFIPERNFKLLTVDYSQIDLRVLASVSEDEVLLEAFKKGKDIHTSTAYEIFKLKPEEVNENYRRIAKTINFGIIYGISAYGLAQELLISQEEAQRYIDDYFERYTKVKLWVDNTLEFACKRGYVTTLLGRIRYIPEINSTNTQVRNFAERIAVNTPIQGTSADIIKIAMINIYKKLKAQSAKCKMLIQLHDELLFEVPEDELKEVTQLVKSEMENAIQLKVPIVVDIKIGDNWRDIK
ncbi:MAG: DNA polymerase I, partial [Elusimicrobiota bacterium]|nr:DNA polymerase I [Elusimicrobiota bacterium]